MNRTPRHNLAPTSYAQKARRQAAGLFIVTAVLAGGTKLISEAVGNHGSNTTELAANPNKEDQRSMTIGPSGLFPNLPASVLGIAAKNPQLSREDIRARLLGEVNAELDEQGIDKSNYNQFQPGIDTVVEVPENWGVGTQAQEDNDTTSP